MQQPEPTPPVLSWPSGCPGRPVALPSSTQQLEPTQQRRHDPAVELAVRLPYPALRSSTQLYAATGTYPAGVALAVRLPWPSGCPGRPVALPSNVGMTRPLSWPSGCPTQLYAALCSSTQQLEPTQQRRHDPAVELAYPATGTYPAGR